MRYARIAWITAFVALWVAATGAMSYVAVMKRPAIIDAYDRAERHAVAFVQDKDIGGAYDRAWQKTEQVAATAGIKITDAVHGVTGKISDIKGATRQFLHGIAQFRVPAFSLPSFSVASTAPEIVTPAEQLTLSEIIKQRDENITAQEMARVSPASGVIKSSWTPDQPALNVEAVLVPRQVTVVSSSQDGRIANIPVDHGDRFLKGDVLVSYDCAHLVAEADIAKIEKKYTEKRKEGSDALFKLEIISDLDRIGALVEDQKATAKDTLYQSRLKDCEIRAEFDGRVTNRLANPGEYTRTDRVLLEVASEETLQAEFLMPSKWLRWVNVGAPVTITIAETERAYPAKVTRIYGEVDPVSQSIQMIAALDSYSDPLLPGMSGKATISIDALHESGVRGYLEAPTGADAP